MLTTRIKKHRLLADLSQGDLADRVGVRRETIGHLERGTYNPSLKLAWDIAKVFDVRIEDLFSFDGFEGNVEREEE
ncbi:MAG: helix-turn-helix transcriptional regulator [Actinomycetia bacterium]|nr:helix-turn-helix transcriptional regulator [Actinomycetes bacterium]